MQTILTIHQFVTTHINIAITVFALFGILLLTVLLALIGYTLIARLYTKAMREMTPKAFFHSTVLLLSAALVRGRWVDMHILKIVHLLGQIRELRPKMYAQIKTALAETERASASQASSKPLRTGGSN